VLCLPTSFRMRPVPSSDTFSVERGSVTFTIRLNLRYMLWSQIFCSGFEKGAHRYQSPLLCWVTIVMPFVSSSQGQYAIELGRFASNAAAWSR